MNFQKSVVTIFLIIVSITTAKAQFEGVEGLTDCCLGFMCCTKSITSDEVLPEKIKLSIDSILVFRLGALSDRVKFSSGQWIDLDELFKITPSHHFEWIVPEFELYYSFSDSTLGINRYIARLWLDHFGQIIRFDFPHKSDPKKLEFIGWQKALKIARQFPLTFKPADEGSVTDFYYHEKSDKMIWSIDFLKESKNQSTHYLRIKVDAIQGEVVDTEEISVWQL